jgi:hypothetical protein
MIPCMTCRQPFSSAWYGNRMCKRCLEVSECA